MERKYNPDDLSVYLKEAEEFQTFTYDPSDMDNWNTYSGYDELSISSIQDNHIYALVHPGNIAEINNKEPLNVKYFFDQVTYDKFVDPLTGKFDATALSEALQLDPQGYPNYRDSIVCFDVHPEKVSGGVLQLPSGTCWANTQFGGGGAHQTFAPRDISADLQTCGALQINLEKSHFNTGTNTAVSAERQADIDIGVDERQNNCITNGTSHHDTTVSYSKGFTPTPDLVGGQPFNQMYCDSESALAEVVDVEVSVVEVPPPLLHDLTSLQIEASRRYGMTAEETLACVQHLYEAGDATYPRTSSHYITSDMDNTVASLLSDADVN